MRSEHRDRIVDERDIAVAAGIVGELLARKASDDGRPQIEVSVAIDPGREAQNEPS